MIAYNSTKFCSREFCFSAASWAVGAAWVENSVGEDKILLGACNEHVEYLLMVWDSGNSWVTEFYKL